MADAPGTGSEVNAWATQYHRIKPCELRFCSPRQVCAAAFRAGGKPPALSHCLYLILTKAPQLAGELARAGPGPNASSMPRGKSAASTRSAQAGGQPRPAVTVWSESILASAAATSGVGVHRPGWPCVMIGSGSTRTSLSAQWQEPGSAHWPQSHGSPDLEAVQMSTRLTTATIPPVAATGSDSSQPASRTSGFSRESRSTRSE